jgi:nucleotide-binding universal stress UspA family protein
MENMMTELTRPAGHPLVVGVVPGQRDTVAEVAAVWAAALGGRLVFAYADPSRYVLRHHPDGTVDHAPVDPDSADDGGWERVQEELRSRLARIVDPTGVAWEFRYLAGSREAALAQLAGDVDASAIITGTRGPGAAEGMRELFQGSVAVQLAHHQSRPVIMVPTNVVGWTEEIL